MDINIIPPDKFKSVPWKNGQGTTQELLSQPSRNGEGFAWRLSMAQVVVNGAFSDFSGYQRTLVLVEGRGMTLEHSNGAVDSLVDRFDCAHFDGGLKTFSILHNGAIVDFNVMVDAGECSAIVNTFDNSDAYRIDAASDALMLYPVDDEIIVCPPDCEPIGLNQSNLLHARFPISGEWMIHGGAFICIKITCAQ
jgi:environmental stress-induced protein Ves